MLNQSSERTNRMTGGVILVAIGILTLLGQTIKNEWLGPIVLLGIGITFLAAGLYTRGVGWIIPGGIVSGVGVGTLLVLSFPSLTPETRGAMMLLAMGAGFGIIAPLSAMLGCRMQWWSLIVASAFAVIGGALWIGGAALDALQLANYVWPLALIAIGASIIVRRQ